MARKAKIVAPVHQAPDADSAADAGTESSKRKQVSKRLFLGNGDGGLAERMEEANGARYVLLDPAGNHELDYTFGDSTVADKFFAIMGFHTKIGNVANTVLNDKDEPGTPADAAAAIKDFLAGVAAGTWAERTGGVGGQKIDRDALAGSIVHVKVQAGKITPEQADAEYARVRQRLDDDKAYMTGARQVTEVGNEYARRIGKTAKTIDDL